MSLENVEYRNRYSVFEIIKLGVSVILTRLFYRKAKLISYPVYMRGKKSLEYGRDFSIGYGCRFDLINPNKKTLFIGDNCEVGDYCHFVACENVTIGDNFLGASKIFISDTNHGNYQGKECSRPDEAPDRRRLYTKPVVIGNNVWVGDNAVILAGTKIGNGCVIGANAVVKGEFPDGCIIVGAPAKIVKKYNDESKLWEKV